MPATQFIGTGGTLSIGGEVVGQVVSWNVAGDAFNLLKKTIEQVARIFSQFFDVASDVFWDVACKFYLERHRRLPGSQRTARLRKKRRAVVMAWFEAEMERMANAD